MLIEKYGLGFTVGNTLDAYTRDDDPIETLPKDELDLENYWCSQKITPEIVHHIRSIGFKTLRIPVTWHNHYNDETGEISPRWIGRVKELIDMGLNEDMYCILDMHHDDVWFAGDEEKALKRFTGIWTAIATYFKGYAMDKLMYEPFREISKYNDENAEIIDKRQALFNEEFVKIVREIDGCYDRTLIVKGHLDSATTLVRSKFPEDPNVMIGVQFYYPFDFTETILRDGTTLDSFDQNNMLANLLPVNKIEETFGYKPFITEIGCCREDRDAAALLRWFKYLFKYCRQRDIPICMWDNGYHPEEIVDRCHGKILLDGFEELMKEWI